MVSFLMCIVLLATIAMPFASMTAEAGTPSVTYTGNFSSAGNLPVTPEGNWVSDPITVTGAVTITRLDISLGITHANPADLQIWIANPAGAAVQVPWVAWGGPRQTFQLNNFNGQGSLGVWRLWLVDGVVNGITGTEDYCTLGFVYSLGSNIITPAVSAAISGNYAVSVSMSSASSGRLFVDDQWVSDLTYNAGTARWEYTLSTTAFPDGAHTVTAISRDYAGNEVADGHPVTFDNWNVYANFGNPPAGATISGNYAVTCSVPGYAVRGELYVDGALAGVDTTVAGGVFSITVDTRNYPDGIHNLVWLVFDPDGNRAAAARGTTFRNYAITCTIASPSSGSTVSGSTTVTASVPAYATRGDLYLDGTFLSQDLTISGGQYSFTLDTTNYPDGIHVLTVQAYDPDGKSAVGASSVTFSNYDIQCSIVSPGTGSPLSGSWTVWATTSSYAARGELLVDGSLYAVTTSLQVFGGTYYQSYTLNTRDFPDGNHLVVAISYDPWGQSAASSRSYVFDNYQIYVTMTAPGTGSTVSGTVLVNASVPAYAVRGELSVDGSPVGVDTTITGGQYQFSLDTTGYPDGLHNLRVSAYDPDGAAAFDSRGVIVDNYNIAVSFVQPLNGFSISGSYTVVAAVPSYSVKGELYVDDALQATAGAPNALNQYRFTLDTTRFADGNHQIRVQSYDPDGNAGAATVSGAFDNWQISAAFLTPAAGGTVSGTATATVAVPAYAAKGELFVDGTLVATDMTVSGGQHSFSFDTRSFPDGYHVLGATAYDPDGNFASDSRSVLVDNYQIYCTMVAPASGATISGRTYTVRASVPAYAVLGELYIDGSLYATTTTRTSGEFRFTLDTTAFPDGLHAVTAVAYDPDGARASASVSALVDNYQISVTMSTSPSGSTLSGTVQVYASVPNYATYGELYVNDALFGIDTTRDAQNRFQLALETTRYPDGAYRLKWQVYDPDGKSAVATLNVDFNNYRLPVNFVNLPATISGTASVTVSVPSYAVSGELYLDGALVATDTSISGGNYVFSFNTAAFRDGIHTLGVKVFDPYSNYAAAAASIVIDNYNIAVTMVAPPNNGVMSGASFLVRASVPAYSVKGELYIDGGLWATTKSMTSGEYRFGLDTRTLPDGRHSVMVVAYDPDGNSGSATVTATVDNYQISVSVALSPGGSRVSGTVMMYGYVPSYAVKGEFYVDGQLVAIDYTTTYNGAQYYFNASLDTTTFKDGFHTFRAVAYDPDGNAAVAQLTVEVDNWQPYAILTAPPANSLLSGAVWVNATVPSYARKGELYVDGAFRSSTTTITSGQYRFNLDSRTVGDGWHSLGVRVYDPDGESAFSAVSVLLDNTPPELWNVTVRYPPGQTAVKKGDFVSVSVQAGDASGGSGLYNVWMDASNLGGGGSEMLDDGLHNDSSSLDGIFGSGGVAVDATMGLHFAFITATDRAGNKATVTAKVSFDTHDPIITSSYVVYPPGQTAARFGDQVRIVSRVIDTKMTVDTVLVIDTSGSMSGNPIRDARNAAKTFVGLMGENDRAAVYSFHGGQNNQPKQEMGFTSNKASLNSTIDGLSAGDWTPLYDAVWTAVQYAKTSPNLPVVIILTDGNDITGYDAFGNPTHSTHTLEDCKYASIPVYTIGLVPGPAYDPLNETVLKEIAQTSDGGSYYKAPDSSQLQKIYEDLARVVEKMDVGGIMEVYCDATPVGGPAHVGMHDDGAHDDLGVGDGYFGSDWTTVGSASTAVIGVTTAAEDVAGNRDTDTAQVRVDNTPPVLSGLTVRYKTGQWWAADGDGVSFVARVVDLGAVAGLKRVELDASDIGGPSSVAMRDDGAGGDSVAGDGNWTSGSVTVATGSNTRFFVFRVTGQDNASNSASQAGNIYIDNGRPLTMSITSPGQDQHVEGLVTMRVQATDLPAILDINLTLLPPNTVYQTAYNGLSGFFERPLDTVQLPDGTYYLGATGRDIALRTIPSPAMVTFYIDNHAPALKLNAPKNNDYVSGVVTVDTAGTTDTFLLLVEYNVDGLAWVPASTAWDTTALADGRHTLAVRAVDRAGHVTSTTLSVTVDNTNPTCRIVAPAAGGILSGRYTIAVKASDSVGIARVDITGDLAAEAEYKSQSGYYEVSLDTRDLPDGNYTIGARSRDDSGREATAAEVSFRVDNTAPTLGLLSPAAYSFVAGTVLVQLLSDDGPFTAELSVEFRVDERGWVALGRNGALWAAPWDTGAFGDGAHSLQVRSTDVIGNVAAQTVALTVDNNAPVCQIYSPLPGQYTEGKQLFQVLATDEVGVVNVTLAIPLVGTHLMSFNGFTGYYEYSLLTTNFPDGGYNATVTALDRSGQTTVAGPMGFHIDNVAPSFRLVRPREGEPITDNITVEVEWSPGRAAPDEAKVTYRVDTGAWLGADLSTPVSSLADGPHTVTVRAEDAAGHITDVTVRIFVDKEWPELSVLAPKSGVHVNGAVDLRVKARDAAGMASLTIARGNLTPEELFQNGATGFYEHQLDLSGLPDGSYNFTLTATDLGGHETVSNLTVVWDTNGPALALVAPSSGGDKKGQVRFQVAATDPSGVSKVGIRLRSGDWRDMRLAENGNYVYTWDTTEADDGQRVAEVRAQDRLGNEVYVTYDLTVRNHEANIFADHFNFWLLLVLIIGFGVVTYAVLRRPRYPVQYIEGARPAVSPARVAGAPPPVPAAKPGPAPEEAPPLPKAAQEEEQTFEPDEEPFFARKAAPPTARGGAGASVAAAAGVSAVAGRPLSTVPPPEETGFEEVTDGGVVEELRMEEPWMPGGSLPKATEAPRAAIYTRAPAPAAAPAPPPARTPAPAQAPSPARTTAPAPTPAAAGDMWEEEEAEEEFFEEDRPAAPPARPAAPEKSHAPPPSRGLSPLEQQMLSMGLNLRVTRTEEERKRRGPPPGWSHPRPAELPPPEPERPAVPSRPRGSEGVTAPPSALKPVPPGAQKLTPKDREKMGAMLDDLLGKSRKR
ncbi:MAG: VWA domain-containing protein [Euryarchaeota archaeon]|nr:VWA domain-containing protein [Euryarchaeota archaeon]